MERSEQPECVVRGCIFADEFGDFLFGVGSLERAQSASRQNQSHTMHSALVGIVAPGRCDFEAPAFWSGQLG